MENRCLDLRRQLGILVRRRDPHTPAECPALTISGRRVTSASEHGAPSMVLRAHQLYPFHHVLKKVQPLDFVTLRFAELILFYPCPDLSAFKTKYPREFCPSKHRESLHSNRHMLKLDAKIRQTSMVL